MVYASKYAHSPRDIPETPHYVILTGSSIHIPGDERSRTNPGHGYPASTEYHINYQIYDKKEDWEEQIRILTDRRESFKAGVMTPVKITTMVNVDIDLPK